MRFLVVALAFVASLAFTAPVVFFAVMFLAGPHSGLLPASAETAVLVAGWLLLVAVPVLVARWVWRHQSRGK